MSKKDTYTNQFTDGVWAGIFGVLALVMVCWLCYTGYNGVVNDIAQRSAIRTKAELDRPSVHYDYGTSSGWIWESK